MSLREEIEDELMNYNCIDDYGITEASNKILKAIEKRIDEMMETPIISKLPKQLKQHHDGYIFALKKVKEYLENEDRERN